MFAILAVLVIVLSAGAIPIITRRLVSPNLDDESQSQITELLASLARIPPAGKAAVEMPRQIEEERVTVPLAGGAGS